MDELFHRENRVSVVTFKQGAATGHKSINPGCVNTSNFVLIYAKNKAAWKPNRVFTGRERDKRYSSFIVNRGEDFRFWKFTTLGKAFAQSLGLSEREAKKQLGEDYEEQLNEFVISKADSVFQPAPPNYDGISAAAREMVGLADITALYTACFGPPSVGRRIFLRASTMVSGFESLPREFCARVPAP
jgi:adenine-specific DNA-methyltransferase